MSDSNQDFRWLFGLLPEQKKQEPPPRGILDILLKTSSQPPKPSLTQAFEELLRKDKYSTPPDLSLPMIKPVLPLPPLSKPTPQKNTTTTPSVLACQGILKFLLAKKQITVTNGRVLPTLDDLAIGTGRQLKAAFLYNDLAGFSKTVSSQPKEVSLCLLMSFVDLMTRITTHYDGILVDCAGDRTLSVFCRPCTDASLKPVQDAVTCALWMQTIIHRVLSPEFTRVGIPGVSVGIGVDYGDAVVGCVGNKGSKRFIFLGNPANNAAKLQEIARPGQTVISLDAFVRKPAYLTPTNNWQILHDTDANGKPICRVTNYFAEHIVNPPPSS